MIFPKLYTTFNAIVAEKITREKCEFLPQESIIVYIIRELQYHNSRFARLSGITYSTNNLPNGKAINEMMRLIRIIIFHHWGLVIHER